MALEMWETLKEAIEAYTGLSPATFISIVAVTLVFFHTCYGFFDQPEPDHGPHGPKSFQQQGDPLPPPVQVGEICEDELKLYDGSDPNKPLLMAIKGQIYDVSQSRMFYGPGGPYALFAGKDASRALAKMSFEEKDLTGDISGLGPFEMEALQDWEYKFMTKYVKVGTVKVKQVPVTNESSNIDPIEAVESTSREVEDVQNPTEETLEASITDTEKKEE